MGSAPVGHCQGKSSVCTVRAQPSLAIPQTLSPMDLDREVSAVVKHWKVSALYNQEFLGSLIFFEKMRESILSSMALSPSWSWRCDLFPYPPTCYTEHCLSENFEHAYTCIHGSIHPEHHPFGIFELILLVTISYQLPLHSPQKMLEHIIQLSQLSVSNHNHKNFASLLRELKGTFA